MPTLAQEIIEAAIDELNEDLEGGAIIAKTPLTTLLGSASSVDSLSLVRLLVTVERIAEERAGKSVVIVDESAFETDQSPFSTVQSLTRHLESLLVM
jgi:acyl carrier protein